jgi:hypothetical protein
MESDEVAELTADAIAKPLYYCADTLAERLGVMDAERSKHKFKTIGAIDVPKAAREVRRREQSRDRSRRYRARNRTMTRAQYEATSISRTKPWLAAGFRCRRTWERHGKPVASPERTILPFNKRDATCGTPPVSHPAAPLLLPPGRNDLADQRPKQPFAPERKAA